jgi:hypothetical protein
MRCICLAEVTYKALLMPARSACAATTCGIESAVAVTVCFYITNPPNIRLSVTHHVLHGAMSTCVPESYTTYLDLPFPSEFSPKMPAKPRP